MKKAHSLHLNQVAAGELYLLLRIMLAFFAKSVFCVRHFLHHSSHSPYR